MSGIFRKVVSFPVGIKTSKTALVSNDIPNLAQVQSLVQGLSSVKEAVATDAHADFDFVTGGLPIIEGYQLIDGDRVLLAGQTDPVENGIYIAGIGQWSRAVDADEASELQPLSQVGVLYGDDAGRTYKLTNSSAPVVDTDPQNWVVTSSSSSASLDVSVDQTAFTEISGANVQEALDSVDDVILQQGNLLGAGISDINDAVGIAINDVNMGSFTGTVLSDNLSVKQLLQELENEIEAEALVYDSSRFVSGSTLLATGVSQVFTHNLGFRFLSGIKVYNAATGEDVTHTMLIKCDSINALSVLNEDANLSVIVACRS